MSQCCSKSPHVTITRVCRRLPGAGAAQAAAATQERGAHPPAAGRGAPGHRAPQQGAPVPVQVSEQRKIELCRIRQPS